MRALTVPGDLHSSTNGSPYQLVVRCTLPQGQYQSKPKGYICIPNGLGATIVILGKLQDMLTEHGYAVLTFDRLGVGFTDNNPTGMSPTVSDVVKECDFAMNSVVDSTPETGKSNIKWVLIGPSMGSSVAQCYIATYPNKVIGFLNMDGVAYPFHQQRRLFNFAGTIYKIYTSIIWTGILRPFIAIASKKSSKMFVSKSFPLNIAQAQLNQSRFFSNIAVEMRTMMDLCEFAARSWGTLNISNFDENTFNALVCAPPNESVEVDPITEQRKIVSDRSPSERGTAWTSAEDMNALMKTLNEIDVDGGQNSKSAINNPVTRSYGTIHDDYPSSQLGKIWKDLIVRVMSARDHDFGSYLGNSFYRQEMKDSAAAEHAIHALLARNGFRTVYPKINHGSIFGNTNEIVSHVDAIFDILDSNK